MAFRETDKRTALNVLYDCCVCKTALREGDKINMGE